MTTTTKIAGTIGVVKIIHGDGHTEELPDTDDLAAKLHEEYPYGFAVGPESRAWVEEKRKEFGPHLILEGNFDSCDPRDFCSYAQLVLFKTVRDATLFKLTWK